MSLSFPYFSIAQHLGVPYTEVLALVEHIEQNGPYDPVCGGVSFKELYCHVENAVVLEYERRRAVLDSMEEEKG